MEPYSYKAHIAHCEEVSLETLAEKVGTPCYVYSRTTIQSKCLQIKNAFRDYPTQACFAVKANSNLSFLREVFSHGFGADVVSQGELERALLAGVNPQQIVFSGVGKRREEIDRAIEARIGSFNVESAHELLQIEASARNQGFVAPISLRINPNIDAKTNPKIATGLYSTKFGLAESDALSLLDTIKQSASLKLVGISCHIGSQILDLAPLKQAAERMVLFVRLTQEKGHHPQFINMGGGLGIKYHPSDHPPPMDAYARTLIDGIKPSGLDLMIEPGRAVAGHAGLLLTRVISVKHTERKTFVIVDAGMNDLIRPTLYGSFHNILPVKKSTTGQTGLCDIVGPVCETGDFLGHDREMVLPEAGELLFVCSVGAYGATMSSHYNSRPRAPEVMVDKKSFQLIRKREALEDLWQSEL